MKYDRSGLTTEKRNKNSRKIDLLSTEQIVHVINMEDRLVAPAVGKEQKSIARAVDMIVKCLRNKGRLFYVGAGTSGRLGVLDASECPPTFSVKPGLVQGLIAGGRRALVKSVEGAEDHAENGITAIRKKGVCDRDVVVGIAACGVTPFVRGALEYAQKIGAATVFITCAPEAVGQIPADVIINPVVGPEVVTGSTRMKAGTATKLVLNTLTTAAMIRMGKVYDNLMVDLKASNEKLKDRSARIVMDLTNLNRRQAMALLRRAEGKVKVAIVMHFLNTDTLSAQKALRLNGDSLRQTIEGAI